MYFSTAQQMEDLDNLAVKSGLQIIQMMELAGWHIVKLFNQLKTSKNQLITTICGKGNKGGDGLSAARHLSNHGWKVIVILASDDLKTDPLHQLKLLSKMNLTIIQFSKEPALATQLINQSSIIIDALIGYHLSGDPQHQFKTLVNLINESPAKVVSYDLPTGIDATTGECHQPCIKANATLTLALPKKAFQTQQGRGQSGKIFVADIGIPTFLYNQISLNSRPDFPQDNSLIKL